MFEPYEYRVIRKIAGGEFHAEYCRNGDWYPCELLISFYLSERDYGRTFNSERKAIEACQKHARNRQEDWKREERNKIEKPPKETFLGKLF